MNILNKLIEVEGHISISSGLAFREDGVEIDLTNPQPPRVLVAVSGGVVSAVFCDSQYVEVKVIDFDDSEADFDSRTIPTSWSDLTKDVDGLLYRSDCANSNPYALDMIKSLAEVEGSVSITRGMAHRDDGMALYLANPRLPRVLVTVSGGVASVVADDKNVDVLVFDSDNYENDPDRVATVPASWADMLPEGTDIPFADDLESSSKRPGKRM